MTETVVVTGATGFIGGRVVRNLLGRGVRVVALHRHEKAPAPYESSGLSWCSYDRWELEGSPAHALIHVAAVRHRHGIPPNEYPRQNIGLTKRLLAAANRRVGRFVLVSSIAVYGWPREGPIDESFPYSPVGPYGESKVEIEQLVRTSGIPYAIVRPSITYGPGDTNGFVEKLFRLIHSRRYLVVGSGANRVQLVYVDDVAHALGETALRAHLESAEYICTFREPITVLELSRLAAAAISRPLPSFRVPVALANIAATLFEALDFLGFNFPGGEPLVTREKIAMMTTDRSYRIDLMNSLLGWEPKTGYADGLRQTARALGIG